MKTKQNVIARLTAQRSDGLRLIVEVKRDATFHRFYHYHTQQGRRWSTKKQYRITSRNDGLNYVNAHRQTPGLEALKAHLENLKLVQFTDIQIRIFKKRAYKQLLHAAPDALGLAKIQTTNLLHKPRVFMVRSRRAMPVGPWLASLDVQS